MRPSVKRRLIVAAAALVALNVGLALADELLPQGFQTGPDGSSFSTRGTGTAALSELLEENGQAVRRITKLTTPLDPDETIMLIDAPLFLTDVDGLRRFVASGGRLVVTTRAGELGQLLDEAPQPAFDQAGTTHTIADGVIEPDTGVITGDARWLWEPRPGAQVLAGEPDAPFALLVPVGSGEIVAIADSEFLLNDGLALSDNAAFAVAITDGRAIGFIEYAHGFTSAFGGAEILTSNLRWTLSLLVAAAAVAMVSVGVRWRPAERTQRLLDPPRHLFVDSVGDTLARTDPTALEPLQSSGRSLLAARLGRSPSDPPSELLAEAPRIGVPSHEAAALFRAVRTAEDAIAVGAAHAILQRPAGAVREANVTGQEGQSATGS